MSAAGNADAAVDSEILKNCELRFDEGNWSREG